jgi:hypothetical protein
MKAQLAKLEELIDELDLEWSLNTDRESAYHTSEDNGRQVWKWLNKQPSLLAAMGFEPAAERVNLAGMTGEMRDIEVHSVRPCRRTAPDGSTHATLVIEITQSFRAEPDQARYRGGCTLLIDLANHKAKYIVRKWLRGSSGAVAQRQARALAAERAANLGIRFIEPGDHAEGMEPFALLHRHSSNGEDA